MKRLARKSLSAAVSLCMMFTQVSAGMLRAEPVPQPILNPPVMRYVSVNSANPSTSA